MYDFCFTPIYAALLAFGGMIGYFHANSLPSLYGGFASAAALALLTYVSLNEYHKGKPCKATPALSLLISLGLTVFGGKKFAASHQPHTGAIMLFSAVMSVFYIWVLGWGPSPNKPSAKKAAAAAKAK